MEPIPTKEENVQSDADLELVQAISGWGGECVRLARMYYPHLPRGNAVDIEPNSTKPEVGSFVLTTETEYGHIAIITDIKDDVLTLTESNVNGDEMITHDRTMSVDDPRIRGYYSVDKILARTQNDKYN